MSWFIICKYCYKQTSGCTKSSFENSDLTVFNTKHKISTSWRCKEFRPNIKNIVCNIPPRAAQHWRGTKHISVLMHDIAKRTHKVLEALDDGYKIARGFIMKRSSLPQRRE
jgi:hypothetical protein